MHLHFKHTFYLDLFICNDFGASNEDYGRMCRRAVMKEIYNEERGEETGGERFTFLDISSLCSH